MFRFLTHDNQLFTTPGTLTLQSVTIQNVFYDIHSLIELSEWGGFVEIKDSVFDYVSTCGSVLSNRALVEYDYEEFLDLDLGFVPEFLADMHNQLSRDSLSEFRSEASSSPFSCDPCFGLTVSDSTFSNFGLFKESVTTPIRVNSELGT